MKNNITNHNLYSSLNFFEHNYQVIKLIFIDNILTN